MLALAVALKVSAHCFPIYYSAAQSCPALYNPMDCSMPGFPVFHHLLEFAQTHTHCVSDVIQPSHPLSSSSPPAFNLSQYKIFSNESSLHIRWPNYWSLIVSPFDEYSGLIFFGIDWFDLLAVQGTLKSSPPPQFEGINSSALSLFYCPALTFIHDHWKNHSLDSI